MNNGARIRMARERKGLSLAQAAERMGISRQAWRSPRLDTVEKLASALDMTVTGLLSVVPDEQVANPR